MSELSHLSVPLCEREWTAPDRTHGSSKRMSSNVRSPAITARDSERGHPSLAAHTHSPAASSRSQQPPNRGVIIQTGGVSPRNRTTRAPPSRPAPERGRHHIAWWRQPQEWNDASATIRPAPERGRSHKAWRRQPQESRATMVRAHRAPNSIRGYIGQQTDACKGFLLRLRSTFTAWRSLLCTA